MKETTHLKVVFTKLQFFIDLFLEIEEELEHEFLKLIGYQHLARGKTLFKIGDEADAVYVLIRGKMLKLTPQRLHKKEISFIT